MSPGNPYCFSQEKRNRQEFLLPYDYVPDMTPIRRDYVRSFFRLLGYDSSGLNPMQIAEVFSLLARLEEYTSHILHNDHNWEPHFASLKRSHEIATPVIEGKARQWVAAGILRPMENVPPLWPERKKFALCLTHDVDSISGDVFWPRIRSLPTFSCAPHREKAIVGYSTLRALGKKLVPRPFFNCDTLWSEWLEIEGRFGFKSTFFFLAQPLPAPHWQDHFYRYSDCVTFNRRRIPLFEVMREIDRSGWEVGLHGSSFSASSQELLQKEREIVSAACGRKVTSIRQHQLVYNIRYTPHFQEKAGLRADSTLGSNVRISFRSGTGLPFFLYDLISESTLDILEVPLIIQDVALFRVMQMDEETAIRQCTEVMQSVAELGGALTLLWHNNLYESSKEFIVYRTLLEEAARLGAWGCSLRELEMWWRTRGELISVPGEKSNPESPKSKN